MTKFLITFSLAVTCTFPANAQSYQPFPTDTASWKVARCWFLFGPGWHDRYTISMDGTDTIYEGQEFKNLFITERQLHGSFDSLYPTRFFGGIREQNKQILMYQKWASVDTSIHLVYDFTNTNIGDTIYTSSLAGPSTFLLGHLVNSVDSVLVGTTYHKRLHMQDPNNAYNTEFWIEGIGSSWGLPFASFWSITDNSYDLNCFYEPRNLKYVNPSPTYGFCTPPLPMIMCDTTLTGSVPFEFNQSKFNIIPNPAYDYIRITSDNHTYSNASLVIYNSIGHPVISRNRLSINNNRIDISKLSGGLYIVSLKSSTYSAVKKLLITDL